MVILTRMILYNRMTINGSYHKFFTFIEESHLLCDIISLDILTTHESCVLVNDFKRTNGSDCVDNYTYHKTYCFTVDICSLPMTRFQS